jgi:hypothetical protein
MSGGGDAGEPTERGLSRRSVLAALGAVGAVSAGAGLATTSFLSDREPFAATMAAGAVDLKTGVTVRHAYTLDGESVERVLVERPPGLDDWVAAIADGTVDCTTDGLADGDAPGPVVLDDLKPGDRGRLTTSLHVCANPSYLSVRIVTLDSTDDRTGTDALETAAGDTDADGELPEALRVSLYVDDGCDGVPDGDRLFPTAGAPTADSLADLVAATAEGLWLGAGPDGTTVFAPGETVCVTLEWHLPETVGNEALTDTVVFEVAAGAVQARHNDDPVAGVPFAPTAGGPTPNDTVDGDGSGAGGSA